MGNERETLNRADLTSQILDNPAYIQAITAVKGELYKAFIDCDTTEDRDEIWRKTKAVESIEKTLRKFMQEGKVILYNKNLPNSVA